MVGHKAIDVADPAVTGYDVAKDLKKQFPVGVTQEDLLPVVAPAREVIDRAGELQSQRPCHGALVSELDV